jgi:hypothetical protein
VRLIRLCAWSVRADGRLLSRNRAMTIGLGKFACDTEVKSFVGLLLANETHQKRIWTSPIDLHSTFGWI